MMGSGFLQKQSGVQFADAPDSRGRRSRKRAWRAGWEGWRQVGAIYRWFSLAE
jgi:hypothetical protein